MKIKLLIMALIFPVLIMAQRRDTIPAILMYADVTLNSNGTLKYPTYLGYKQMKGYVVVGLPAITVYLTSSKVRISTNYIVIGTSIGSPPSFLQPNTFRDTTYLRYPLRRDADTLYIDGL